MRCRRTALAAESPRGKPRATKGQGSPCDGTRGASAQRLLATRDADSELLEGAVERAVAVITEALESDSKRKRFMDTRRYSPPSSS